MILNLMPCVFPVIGIKILSFAQHSNEGRRKARISAFIYAAGIILSFLALAWGPWKFCAISAKPRLGLPAPEPRVYGAHGPALFRDGLELRGAF